MENKYINIPSFNFDQDGTLNAWRWIPLEEVRKEGYFKTVLPHKEVINSSKILQSLGFTVKTYGAAWLDDGHSRNDKDFWMDHHCGHIKVNDRLYVPCGTDKASFFESFYGRPISEQDILIDDCSDVLRAWESYGGTGVKVRTPENGAKGTWRGYSFNCTDCAEAIALYLLSVVAEVSGRAEAM